METRKRAQAAMEFLMTYGWAILVVLIAIGALAYFGVLNPDKFLPEKCVIATGSGLFCDDYSATASDDDITFRLKNLLTEQVTVTYIDLNATGIACDPDTSFTTATISSDGTTDFDYEGCTTDIKAGDKIKGDVLIIYNTGGTTPLAKSATGTFVTSAQ